MNTPPRFPLGRLALLLAIAGSTACAGTVPEVGPVDVPRLEQAVAASPGNTGLQVQLGMAQFEAGDFEASRTTLRGAREAGEESGPLFLYLGMAEEELQNWSAAREAYNVYLDVGSSTPAVNEVRKRLTLIGRNLLRAQAQQALAREQEITATGAITPRSVAVMPLEFNSDREDLEPLIYALSDMMITDFKISNALTVLERAEVQTLLDEMALTSEGYADEETGARAGRMLRAEHVFQGVLTTLGENDLQTIADVLNVPNTSSAGQITEQAVLEQLFDMEKQLVIRTIREVLGVELTPAEEQKILENRMTNVLAFLAYGRGLRELDGGNYDAAQAEFQAALALDPAAFAGNPTIAEELGALQDASTLSTDQLGTIASTTGEIGGGLFGPPPNGTTNDLTTLGISGQIPVGPGSSDGTLPTLADNLTSTLDNVFTGVDPSPVILDIGLSTGDQSRNSTPGQSNPTTRDPVPEAGPGGETIPGVTSATIRIVIPRPGGEQ